VYSGGRNDGARRWKAGSRLAGNKTPASGISGAGKKTKAGTILMKKGNT